MEPPPEDQKEGGTSSGGRGSSNSIANNDNNKATTTAISISVNHQAEQQPLEGFPDGWTKRRIPIKTGGTEEAYHYSPLEQHIFHSKAEASRFLVWLDKANGDENLALEYHTHKKIPPSSMGNTMLTSTNTEHNHSKEGDVSSLNKPTSRTLVANLANGKQVAVKVRLGGKEFVRRQSKEYRPPQEPKKIKPKRKEEVDEKVVDDKEQETSDPRFPKRKRTNVYASLDPAVIQGQIKASAREYAEAEPPPQLAHKVKKRKQSFDVKDKKGSNKKGKKEKFSYRPPVTGSARKKASLLGRDNRIGKDGNLFYCRICLGVGEVVCCDSCPNVYHQSCLPFGPSKISLENDDDPWFCHECMKNKSMIPNPTKKQKPARKNVEQKRQSSTTHNRGRSKSKSSGKGVGKNLLRRMSSSEERMRRSKDSPTKRRSIMRSRTRSSGYQAPFVEDDDDAIGPHSLDHIEHPTCSTPAFFFFLLHNRSGIERSLHRKNRLFRGLPKGLARNEKVAKEGASIWIGMSPDDRKLWVDVSIKDFEERLIAWKEKEVIQSMMELSPGEENVTLQTEESESGELSQLSQVDEAYIVSSRARVNQFNKHKSQPVRVSANSNGNSILLELLNDARFRPLPLVSVSRAQEDLASGREKSREWKCGKSIFTSKDTAVEQFHPIGPFSTGLGDDCIGCTRGWNHFCTVLKRQIPCAEQRAKLQPPVSSLSATRIGLGLKVNLPSDKQLVDEKDIASGSISKYVPNYHSRNGFSLSTPQTRLDDVTAFIESAAAMRNMQIESNDNGHVSDSPTQGLKSKMKSRGLLPMRGRKKDTSNETDSAALSNVSVLDSSLKSKGDDNKKTKYRCGGCGSIQQSPLGCLSCRKAKLIAHVAKQNSYPPNTVADEFLKRSKSLASSHFGDGFAKATATMLGRSSLNDTAASKRDEEQDKIGMCMTREGWNPSVIMQPNKKQIPTRKTVQLSDSDDESSSDEEEELKASECSSSSVTKKEEDTNKRLSSPRSCTSKGEVSEISQDRHALAVKHKDDANELARKCLEIACSGILLGMVRRDPLRLFAESVPRDVAEYHQVIQDPIDFSTMRKKIMTSQYTSLTLFVNDARRLCINACVFNAADSLYAKTAKQIYDSLEIMIKRAKDWTTSLKNAHSSSFLLAANMDSAKDNVDMNVFKDVKRDWPGAVELLEDGDWLKKQAVTDFTRTRENELAYYGSLAMQRATSAAANASLVGDEGMKLPVVKRSHVQDDLLRKSINEAVSLLVGPVELKDEPDTRELQLFNLLKAVQKRREDGRLSSESGCARCDGDKIINDEMKSLRSFKIKRSDVTKARVEASRQPQSTGLASLNARKSMDDTDIKDGIGRVATESEVSVRGSQIHGWGLYADRPFKKGEIVSEYVGQYISGAVADVREKRYRDERIQDYQFRVDNSLVIDATKSGGYGRYINHSCSPNCFAKIVDGKPPNKYLKRVLIISQQSINVSEELSYDYQFPLETDLDARIPCNCGSKQCRGFMN